MKRRPMSAILITLFCLAVCAPALSAEEAKYELKYSAATIKDVLSEYGGKRVVVQMESGESLEGTVAGVGDILLHLEKIAGRDFYDALVRVDRISGVVFKVRSK